MKRSMYIGLAASAALTPSALPAEEAPESLTAIQEVVVTARKRAERIESVPDSIRALSGEDLESAGLTRVNEVTRHVPNFTLVEAQQPGVVLINIRGVGQVRNGEAPVAVVIDGVQQNSPNQITQALYDVERLEVLKGPQGALYGRNAIGGAINIVTRAPTNELKGSLEAGGAQGDDFYGQATLSGPIVRDKVLFRVSGRYADREGQIDNIFVGGKADFDRTWNGRAALLFHLSERWTADVRAALQDQRGGASYYVPGAVNSNPTQVIGNLVGWGERDLADHSIKLERVGDATTFTSISAYSRVESGLFEELDWLPADLLAATQFLDVKAYSQELRLASNNETGTRWIAG